MGWVKIRAKLLIFVLSVILLAASVSAANIVEDSVFLNVDYEAFDQDDEETIPEATAAFTIENTGAADVSVTLQATLPSSYNANDKQITVPAGDSVQTTFAIDVPHEQDGGSQTIGEIALIEDGSEVDSISIIQVTEQMIVFKEIDVKFVEKDGTSEKDDFNGDDEDRYQLSKDVRVDSLFEITFEVENRYGNDNFDDSTIDNIEIQIDADDNEVLPDDFDDTLEFDSLDAGDDDRMTIEWIIPEDADEGGYVLEFTLEGEDDNGNQFEVIRELGFDLERERDDVRITRAEINPNPISPDNREYELILEIKNFGTRDQDHAGLIVFNEDLDIDVNVEGIELEEFDEDDTWAQSYDFRLPKDMKPGRYDIEVRSYIKRDEQSDFELINLVIEQDAGSSPTVEDEPEEEQVEQPEEEETSEQETEQREETTSAPSPEEQSPPESTTGEVIAPTGHVVQTVESSYSTLDLLVAGVIVAILLVLALIVLFFVLLMRK